MQHLQSLSLLEERIQAAVELITDLKSQKKRLEGELQRALEDRRAVERQAEALRLEKEEITVAQLIVSLLRQVTQSFDERVRLPGLRLIYTGGETLRAQDVARCARVLPDGCRVIYDYGSTEAGIITHQLVNLSSPAAESPVQPKPESPELASPGTRVASFRNLL